VGAATAGGAAAPSSGPDAGSAEVGIGMGAKETPGSVDDSLGKWAWMKCIGATFAGSLFALAGMLVEGRRDQKAEQSSSHQDPGSIIPKKQVDPMRQLAQKNSLSSASVNTSSGRPSSASSAGSSCGEPRKKPSATKVSARPMQARQRSARAPEMPTKEGDKPMCGGVAGAAAPGPGRPRVGGGPQKIVAADASIGQPGTALTVASRPPPAVADTADRGVREPRSIDVAAEASGVTPRRRRVERQTSVDAGGPDALAGQRTPSSARVTRTPTVVATPSLARRPVSNCDLSEVQRVERQVKAILNKLTRERFETLYAQLLGCCENVEARSDIVQVIAREVFSKATQQRTFVEMYADVCSRLHSDLQNMDGVEVNFKRILLDQCQESFTQHLEPPRIDTSLDYEEQYEVHVKYKTKMLGNVRLIGHLLRQRMLSPKIVFLVTDELLAIGSPEALETLCTFLDTLGSAFDNSKEWNGRAKLEEVFTKVELLSIDSHQPARTRCLLKDLIDKRKRRWRELPIGAPVADAATTPSRRQPSATTPSRLSSEGL